MMKVLRAEDFTEWYSELDGETQLLVDARIEKSRFRWSLWIRKSILESQS